MVVYNMATGADKTAYIVVRMVNGQAWYYGAWDDINKAIAQATEVRGIVIPTHDVVSAQ